MSLGTSAGLAARLRAAADAEPAEMGACSGSGIVICAGGARLFTCAWLLIAMLRRTFACRLPIEVWHLGPGEMGPPMRALLETLDVTVIDALAVARRHPAASLGGWQLKTFALLHSRFREILLLDADNMAVKDPAFLFDTAEYRDAGVLFWPDIVRLKAANAIWRVAGIEADAGPSFETGQILIDKARHWRTLALAHWINQEHVAFEDMLYGDKDAFYVAWRMMRADHHLIRHPPKLLEFTFAHRAPSGELLFQHRSGAKWLLHGANPRIEGFRFEEACFALLSELRLLWDGAIFNPPNRSMEAMAIERALAETAHFRLIAAGSHEYELQLARQHLVIGGGAEAARSWYVADGPAGPELRLMRGGLLDCALHPGSGGTWVGEAAGVTVRLQPVAAVPDSAADGARDAAMIVVDQLLGAIDARALIDEAGVASALAILAQLHEAIPAYLESRAEGNALSARTAAAALRPVTRHIAMPRAGTGWRTKSGDLGAQSEAVKRR